MTWRKTEIFLILFSGNRSVRLGAALFATKKRILQEHEIQIHRHTSTGKLYDYVWTAYLM